MHHTFQAHVVAEKLATACRTTGVEERDADYCRFYVTHNSQATGSRCWGWLLGLFMTFSLAGCAAWTSPTPPSTAFDDAATACQVEIMQAVPTSGISESNQYDAYIACLHDKGW